VTRRFPFDHPEIAAVLEREHAAAAADTRKLVPRLPRYFWAKLTGRLADESFRKRVFSDVYSAVTEERGALLYVIARAIAAKRVVEFGSSFGISAIYLATAVHDNFPDPAARAQVIGSEMDSRKIAAASKNIEAAGLAGVAHILQGDARETLRGIEGPVDMVFLDGRKDLYLDVVKVLEGKMRPGAVVVADNIDSFASDVVGYLEYVRGERSAYASSKIGISDGMEMSVFRG
jgi:predicted O-methyltransferase YrrM